MLKRLISTLGCLLGAWFASAAEQVPDFTLADVNPASNRQAGQPLAR